MTEAKRNRLRALAKKRRDDAIASAKKAFDGEMAAIEVVFRLESTARRRNGARQSRQRTPDLSRHVQDVVSSFASSDRFTATDVEQRLHGRGLNGDVNRKSVTNILSRLVELGGIVQVVDAGAGRRPTFYGLQVAAAED